MRLLYAARHPLEAGRKALRRARLWLLVRGWGDAAFWRAFERELGAGEAERARWSEEADALETQLVARWRRAEGLQPRTGLLEAGCRRALYLAARALRARSIVETGVANGASSFVLLSALAANGGGRLWSLEPEGASPFVPKGFDVGWLVPDGLRGSWELVRRPSLEALPEIWTRAAPIDLFFHDSDHTEPLMRAEYEAAWPNLRPGGVLASDDVSFNDAFPSFAAERDAAALVWRARLGLARKAA